LKTQLLLGIDAGLSATKAALFDRDGREVSAVSVSNPVLRPRPGSAERAMDEAWASAALVVRKALDAAGVDGGAVAGVGVTGAMVGVWPIDAEGRPVRPAVLVADVRGQEVIDRIAARDPDALSRIFAVDGCVVEPGCTLPVLRWLLDEEPEVMAAARHALTCKDWLRYRLTGAIAADVTEAAVAPGDARARGRSAEMLRLFGLEAVANLLPPVRRSESLAGEVTPAAAAETGLRAGTPVAIGAGDVPCSAIGAGAFESGVACTVLGTTCHNGVVFGEPMFEPPNLGLLFTLPENRWLRVMVNLAGTPNLDWARGALFSELGAGGAVFAELERAAASRPAGVDGLLYHPYLSDVGLIAPVVSRGARAQFSGLTSRHGRADLLRAVYEGVAYAIRDCYAAIGRPLREIRLVGGGARSVFWSQTIADVTGTPVVAPQGSEFGALGAALLASVAIGWSASVRDAALAPRSGERRYEPNGALAGVYDEAFARYRAEREAIVALAAQV
jgi:sugar (pentulose or hexulose) kinase